MKLFLCAALFVVIASLATATSVGSSTSAVNGDRKQDVEGDLKSAHASQLNNENRRFKKSAEYGSSGGSYGLASVPASPCPKNYLFSCQPNLAPVPCSAPAHPYGAAGAYSAPVPTYVAPLGHNYGLPQGYVGFAPQAFNQFYPY